MRPDGKRLSDEPELQAWLAQWRARLLTRRRFLQLLSGGLAASWFPRLATTEDGAETLPDLDEQARWRMIDIVQRHLFPSEPDAPGAREIGALAYLQFILNEDISRAEDREFLLDGAGWLEGMSEDLMQSSFHALDEARREQVLRKIEQSEAGRNWLSLLLLYLIEALLTDPVYGGNIDRAGWQWLAHIHGFPTPPPDKRYTELLKR